MWRITEALVRLVAPILTFTADEIWEHLPAVKGRPFSVHLALFPKPEEIFSEGPAPVLAEWQQLFDIRDNGLRILEEERQAKRIGKALEAKLFITIDEDGDALVQKYRSSLKELFNVSEVEIVPRAASDLQDATAANPSTHWGSTMLPGNGRKYLFRVDALPASGHKCARCWNFMPAVSSYGIWNDVCDRCQGALREMGIKPPEPDSPHSGASQPEANQ